MADIKVVTPDLLGKYDAKSQARQAKVDEKTLADAKAYTDEKVGAVDDLSTTAKGNVVAAVNELAGRVTSLGTTGSVTIDTSVTTEGMSKSYTIKQGDRTVGTIDVPKDMVVSSGEVTVVSAEQVGTLGHPAGTYLVLTLANATSDKVWINLNTLIDVYTAKANATQIQLTVNPRTKEISATVVAGSITTRELADASVTTAKIANGNVTKAKLASDVVSSLTKADSSVQRIVEGTRNGTVSVDGTEVSVHGLGSGAYTNITEATEEDINSIFATE